MNISAETLKKMKDVYGKKWSSWAIWAEAGKTPMSNVSDMSIFDPEKYPEVREALHNRIVAVGLNVSAAVGNKPFVNFHSDSPHARDYKLRYAFMDTPAWGCYLTDILKDFGKDNDSKDFVEVNSSKVMKAIRANRGIVDKHFKMFREEISMLGAQDATFLGLGGHVSKLLKQALPKKDFPNARIINVMHYSAFIGKEAYREKFLSKLRDNGLL